MCRLFRQVDLVPCECSTVRAETELVGLPGIKSLLSQVVLGGTSLVVQWLRLCAPNAGGLGSISGRGTRSHMHATTKGVYAATKEPACCN